MHNTFRRLKGCRNSYGYMMTILRRGSLNRVNKSIHSLVAAAFLGPCPEGMEINHKNAIKTDNRVENLEYVTRVANLKHARDLGLVPSGSNRPEAKLNECAVKELRARYAFGGISMGRLAGEYGVSMAAASLAISRKTWRQVA
jgi:hypothetical protein